MHNLWGLPRNFGRPILWIMRDEKWFHALVPRTNAKACETLGLKKSSYSAHHKSHIGKVMVHCTVGYLFKDDPELGGGQAFLIGVNRCAGFKIDCIQIPSIVTRGSTYQGGRKYPGGVVCLCSCLSA
jgi:hypothetical protein